MGLPPRCHSRKRTIVRPLNCVHAPELPELRYFGDTCPVDVAGVGYEPLYDPENLKSRTRGGFLIS